MHFITLKYLRTPRVVSMLKVPIPDYNYNRKFCTVSNYDYSAEDERITLILNGK